MLQFPDSIYTDEELLTLLRQGSRFSFEILYKKYWKQLFNSAYKRLPSREIVEELVQDIFVDLWSKREILEIHSSLSAYLFTALRYKLFSYFRAQLIRQRHQDFIMTQTEYYENFVEDQLYYEELAKALDVCVKKLPDKCRTVYQLSRAEHLTYKEIAIRMNMPVDTVEKQMGKALKLLRVQLKEFAWLAVLCAGLSN